MSTPTDEKSVFNKARSLAAPQERTAYLQQVFGHDPAAMHRVLELLRVYEQEKSFLESPAVAPASAVAPPIRECPGMVLGPYKLMEQIGEGGMGLIFVAE